jgi:hypothetical protein
MEVAIPFSASREDAPDRAVWPARQPGSPVNSKLMILLMRTLGGDIWTALEDTGMGLQRPTRVVAGDRQYCDGRNFKVRPAGDGFRS